MKPLPKFLLFCLILVFLLRLPSLFEPYWYGDEGIYLTLGQALRQELTLYKDIHDNKPPLLYLLAGIAGNLSLFREMLIFWMLATTFIFYKLTQTLFPQKEKLSKTCLILFAILSSIPLIEGNIANAEIFMIGTTITGFYLFLRAKKAADFLFSGIFFSLSLLFKVPAIFDFAALGVFALLTFKKKNLQTTIRQWSLIILGFSAPILLTFIYFAHLDALGQYFLAAFSQNLPYLFSWRAGAMATQSFGSKMGLIYRSLFLAASLMALFFFRKKIPKTSILISSWFLFSLFAATLSERPYPHYLIQVLPSFCLILAASLTHSKAIFRQISLGLIAALAASIIAIQFWVYPVLGYYTNFLRFTLGAKNQELYFAWFNPQTKQIYQVADFLANHTQRKEKIFIWGDKPFIYALAKSLPVGRYTVAYHIVDFNGYQETIEALNKTPPRFLIVDNQEKRAFPALLAFIQKYYTLQEQIGDFSIFRRIIK